MVDAPAETKVVKNADPSFTFYMDTKSFVQLWHDTNTKGADWGAFLIGCWQKFSNGEKTRASLAAYSKATNDDHTKWDHEAIKKALSKRAYAKCTSIRKKLIGFAPTGQEDKVPNLPKDAVQDYGKVKASPRLSAKDIWTIFNG